MLRDSPRAKIQAQGLALLSGPEFPEQIRYLWEWYRELRAGAEESMNGLHLTWTALDAWSRHTGNHPKPSECAALFDLDAVIRNPPKD